MGQIRRNSRCQAVLTFVVRVPGLLGSDRSLLPQGREGDLTPPVLDPRPPGLLFPIAQLPGMLLQGHGSGLAVLITQVMGIHLTPVIVFPPVVSGTAGRHQVKLRPVGVIGQGGQDLVPELEETPAGDDGHGAQMGQSGKVASHDLIHPGLRQGQGVVQIEGQYVGLT